MGYNKDILGWMPETDLIVLEKLSKNVTKNGNIVEVGSMFGKSSICFAMSVDPSVTITCIDMFSKMVPNSIFNDIDYCISDNIPLPNVEYNSEEVFYNNTKEFKNIKMVKGYSPKYIEYTEKIDLFFLDGAHYNPNDWDNLCYFIPLIKDGGILCGHDYSDEYKDIINNVKRLEKIIGTKVTLYINSLIWSFVINYNLLKIDKLKEMKLI